MPLEEHDERTIRCKRLGHAVAFRYCRVQEGRTICPQVLDCWWETFDVRAFLEDHLPPDEMERLRRGEVKPKVLGLVELIKKGRARRQGQAGRLTRQSLVTSTSAPFLSSET